MNFQSKTSSQTTSSNNVTSQSNSKSYPKLIDEVNSYWLMQLHEIEKIKSDIKSLERMFNDYSSDSSFIDCKDILVQTLQEKQQIINQLEEQFYVMKRNFNIT